MWTETKRRARLDSVRDLTPYHRIRIHALLCSSNHNCFIRESQRVSPTSASSSDAGDTLDESCSHTILRRQAPIDWRTSDDLPMVALTLIPSFSTKLSMIFSKERG